MEKIPGDIHEGNVGEISGEKYEGIILKILKEWWYHVEIFRVIAARVIESDNARNSGGFLAGFSGTIFDVIKKNLFFYLY